MPPHDVPQREAVNNTMLTHACTLAVSDEYHRCCAYFTEWEAGRHSTEGCILLCCILSKALQVSVMARPLTMRPSDLHMRETRYGRGAISKSQSATWLLAVQRSMGVLAFMRARLLCRSISRGAPKYTQRDAIACCSSCIIASAHNEMQQRAEASRRSARLNITSRGIVRPIDGRSQ